MNLIVSAAIVLLNYEPNSISRYCFVEPIYYSLY